MGKAAWTAAVTVAPMSGVGSGVGVEGWAEEHPAISRNDTMLRIVALIPELYQGRLGQWRKPHPR